jgi:hypothetical protein
LQFRAGQLLRRHRADWLGPFATVARNPPSSGVSSTSAVRCRSSSRRGWPHCSPASPGSMAFRPWR